MVLTASKHYAKLDGLDMHLGLKVWKHPRSISLNSLSGLTLSMRLKHELVLASCISLSSADSQPI